MGRLLLHGKGSNLIIENRAFSQENPQELTVFEYCYHFKGISLKRD